MRLIDQWRRAHKLWSTRIAALAVTFGLLPPDQQTAILDAVHIPANRIPAVVGALFLVSRLVAQPKVNQ